MVGREIVTLVIFIFAISVFAEKAQYSETTLTPPIKRSASVPLLGSQQAPSSNSTEGPAGRPNLELVPQSTGSINALSPSMMKKPTEARRAKKNAKPDAEISRKASSPLPEEIQNKNEAEKELQ